MDKTWSNQDGNHDKETAPLPSKAGKKSGSDSSAVKTSPRLPASKWGTILCGGRCQGCSESTGKRLGSAMTWPRAGSALDSIGKDRKNTAFKFTSLLLPLPCSPVKNVCASMVVGGVPDGRSESVMVVAQRNSVRLGISGRYQDDRPARIVTDHNGFNQRKTWSGRGGKLKEPWRYRITGRRRSGPPLRSLFRLWYQPDG